MGNQEINCKHNTPKKDCPFCADIPLFPDVIRTTNGDVKALPEPKSGETSPIPQETVVAQIGANIEQKKVRGKPFTGADDPRRGRKKKGDVAYKTVFLQALKTLKDKNGKKITIHDVVKSGILPMLSHIQKGDPRFHSQYKDILDRIFGKPTEHVDHTTGGDKFQPPTQIIGMRIVKE